MEGHGMPCTKIKQRHILPNWQPYNYSIIPLLVMKSEGITRGIFTYLLDYEKTMTINGGCFFIKGVKEQISW